MLCLRHRSLPSAPLLFLNVATRKCHPSYARPIALIAIPIPCCYRYKIPWRLRHNQASNIQNSWTRSLSSSYDQCVKNPKVTHPRTYFKSQPLRTNFVCLMLMEPLIPYTAVQTTSDQ
ncbi:hypothetical protein Plhal304r1_c013g0050091 [Plasmopara halstedii]